MLAFFCLVSLLHSALIRRHWAGLQRLAMDAHACAHYQEQATGLGHCVWRLRVYTRGFLRGD